VAFVAGSAASAFAGSAGTLIATRAAMGVGAALIMPSTLSIITNTFPERERGRAIGIWAGVAAGGILLGPVVGGWLLGHFWWGSVFLINIPVVTAALMAAWALVPDSRDPDATPLDPAGALLSIAGLVSLAYAIIQAPTNGWAHPITLGWFAVAVVLLGAFIAWELRSGHPMLPLGFSATHASRPRACRSPWCSSRCWGCCSCSPSTCSSCSATRRCRPDPGSCRSPRS
jgi:MFS family permease